MLKRAGADCVETTFLFSDTQLKKEKFLEDINNILNTGEVLYILVSPFFSRPLVLKKGFGYGMY